MTLCLYWSPDSANLAIRIALETLGLPFDAIRVDRGQAEHKNDAFLKLNPQGLLPVLTDGAAVLFETGAILWHLADRAGRLGPLGPETTDPAQRAAALTWMFYLSNTLHADLRLAFYTHRYVGDPASIPSVLEGLSGRIAGHCALIEAELLEGGLLGQRGTIPDIYLTVCLRWAQIYPTHGRLLPGLEQWPRLHALARIIENSAAARKSFTAESIDPNHALTRPQRPHLSPEEVTGTI
ncbi:MAG: glutathione S-transferase family protein [Pseudomonadota bacterium]